MHIRKALILALALAGLALTVSACGGGSGTPGGATPMATSASNGVATYNNAKYGFRMTYDKVFTEGPSSIGSAGGSGPDFTIAFADTKGTTVGGSYEDGVKVSVGKLASAIKPSQVPALKKQFEASVKQLVANLSSGKIVVPVRPVSVGGARGYAVGYLFSEGSTRFMAMTYFLIKGANEYQVTGQASQQTWSALQPKLEAAMDSFTVK